MVAVQVDGAYMSYWLYQHLGNLSPEELGKNELWRQVRESADGARALRDHAFRADQRADGIRWSFRRDYGGVRVVAIDSRSRRVLEPGRRLMTDDAEWQWVTESMSGHWDHVVLATSLPLLLAHGIHGMEAWNEAVCDGAWGSVARAGERARRAVDLEHWAAFWQSFTRFEQLLIELAAGTRDTPPKAVTVIAGDVHHSCLAAADAGEPGNGAVHQAVCSPIHNVLPDRFQRLHRLASSRAGALAGAALARLGAAPRPSIGWRITDGPWFQNMLATLEFDGHAARIRFDGAAQDPDGTQGLGLVGEIRLT